MDSSDDKQAFITTLRPSPNNSMWLIENDGNGEITNFEFPLNRKILTLLA